MRKQENKLCCADLQELGRRRPCPEQERIPLFKNEKSAQRGSFWAGYPADIRGSFARISRPKTSVRVLELLGKQALGADIHDPKARTSTAPTDLQKLRSQKLWAEFSFLRNTPSTAGNSMTGSERPSPEPLLKKEASPAVLGGR